MAKCKVVGNTVMLTSDHSMEALRAVEERRPDSLYLSKNHEDGSQDICFRVCTGQDESIGRYGICFTKETPDTDPKAIITLEVSPFANTPELAKEWVAKKVGSALLNLRKIDAQVSVALRDIERENESISNAIEFVEI